MNELRFGLILLLSVTFGLYAQDKPQPAKIALTEILAQIQRDHGVTFNYLDKAVADIVAEPPAASLSLPQKIRWLRIQTGLEFSYDGTTSITIIRPKIFTAEQRDSLRVEQLEEVVVRQFLTSGISRRKDGATVISPNQFGLLPGLTEADVLQTMQQLPGVLSADETISNINIRGGTHDQNLFLWNGIRMFQTGHFFGQISAFNPSIPQKITVYKNGTPAYLGESVSGTADINTQTDLNARDVAELGSNLIAAQAFARIRLFKDAAVSISARRSLTDFFDTPTYDSYSDRVFQNTVVTDLQSDENIRYESNRDFYFYDVSLQYHQKFREKHEIIASGLLIENELALDIRRLEGSDQRNRRSLLQQSSSGASLHYFYRPDQTTRYGAFVTGSHFVLNGLNSSIEDYQSLSQQNEVINVGARLWLEKRWEHLKFNGGYQFDETSMENYDGTSLPEFERNDKRVMRTHALSGEASRDFDSGIATRGGIRLNYFERSRLLRIEPRIQVSYQSQNRLRFDLLGEMKSQTAAQVIDLQQDFLGLEKRRWLLSNETEIPIQKSAQLSAGLTYEPGTWLLTLEVFQKQVRGIYSGSQSFQNQLEFARFVGKYDVTGMEALAQKKWGPWRSWLSYAVSRNDYEFRNFVPDRFPNNFHIAHALNAAGIYEGSNLKMALGAKFQTGRPQTLPIGTEAENNSIVYASPNAERLESYFQTNFSATYQWNVAGNAHVELGLSVLNLLNKKFVINRYYRINDESQNIERFDTYSLGRTPNLSFKLSF